VCAFVAASEGKVTFATRVRIDNVLDNLTELKTFDSSEFVELFERFVEEFRASPRKARARALDIIRKGAGDNRAEAELLARIAAAVADGEVGSDRPMATSVAAVCAALGIDPHTLRAPQRAAPAVVSRAPAATPASPRQKPEDQSTMQEDHGTTASPAASPATAPTAAPAADISQQLKVEGAAAVIALCGRTKAGALEALRIYQDEQLAAADKALAESITKQRYWLSPVTLFPAPGRQVSSGGEAKPIHVLCLNRTDGSVEALRAFESGEQANADLEFFRSLTNDKIWLSVVQYKVAG